MHDDVESSDAMVDLAKFAPAPAVAIGDGLSALAGGLLHIERTRSVVAADIHFGYEEVIGGALPLWSIDESLRSILAAVERVDAREIILLGDVVHGARMSEGAALRVSAALTALREACTLTIIAGNHEGMTRGVRILGDTFEVLERDGWFLLHGDEILSGRRCMIGHLHPSVQLGPGKTAPVFLAAPSLVVVPALTPYSSGLNVCSKAAEIALKPWRNGDELQVFGVTARLVYPFGNLTTLIETKTTKSNSRKYRRRLSR